MLLRLWLMYGVLLHMQGTKRSMEKLMDRLHRSQKSYKMGLSRAQSDMPGARASSYEIHRAGGLTPRIVFRHDVVGGSNGLISDNSGECSKAMSKGDKIMMASRRSSSGIRLRYAPHMGSISCRSLRYEMASAGDTKARRVQLGFGVMYRPYFRTVTSQYKKQNL